jgi:hypothetical protein
MKLVASLIGLIVIVIFEVCLIVQKWDGSVRRVKCDVSRSPLEAQITAIYDKSVKECSVFQADTDNCIKTQFFANYRWEVIRDQDRIVGAPGVPGLQGDTVLGPH